MLYIRQNNSCRYYISRHKITKNNSYNNKYNRKYVK